MCPRLRTIRCDGGERLPLLISAQGKPLWAPTVYLTSELRARGLSLNTLRTHMRAVRHFEIYCVASGIDLGPRLADGYVLSPGEIENLAASCRVPGAKFPERSGREPEVSPVRRASAAPREQVRSTRRGRGRPVEVVAPAVASTRLHAIRGYIDWQTRRALVKRDAETRKRLESERILTLNAIQARMGKHNTGTLDAPEGLAKAEEERLLAVTDPDSMGNPWTTVHARIRNALIVRWLLMLGLRRGELLGVQVRDIDFQAGKVEIVRRPDNPDDPRVDPPLVKTRERVLEIEPTLLQMTRTYVMELRRHETGSRYHEYLWVSERTGRPLTLVALQKTFETLKQKPLGLPATLTPHVLRHTWNDRFSERMDELGIEEATERRWRCYLMGWADNSRMAAVYTRRHIRRRAAEAHMRLQEETMAMGERSDG